MPILANFDFSTNHALQLLIFLLFAQFIRQSSTFNFDWCDNETSAHFEPDMAKLIDRFEYIGSECLFASTQIADRVFLRSIDPTTNPPMEVFTFSIESANEFCRNYSAHLPTVRNEQKSVALLKLVDTMKHLLPLGIKKIHININSQPVDLTWDDGTHGAYMPDEWILAPYTYMQAYTLMGRGPAPAVNKSRWISSGTPLRISVTKNKPIDGHNETFFYCEQDRKSKPASSTPDIFSISTTGITDKSTTISIFTFWTVITTGVTKKKDTKTKKTPPWVIILSIIFSLILLLLIAALIMILRQRKWMRTIMKRAAIVSTAKKARRAKRKSDKKLITKKKTKTQDAKSSPMGTVVPASEPPLMIGTTDQTSNVGPKDHHSYASLGHSSVTRPAYLNVKPKAAPTAGKQPKIDPSPIDVADLGRKKQAGAN